uniref:hypothetical protein n=1 Tax=Pedobacter schmidteae TaxID=2201271 RepID=UPI000EB475EB|nr:hypothetical protein [Pedobacter schmidteae]
MKKIFFGAALTIVAISSALTVNAIKVYTVDLGPGLGHGTLIDCRGFAVSCEMLFGTVYYQQCAPQTPVSIEDLEDTFRN